MNPSRRRLPVWRTKVWDMMRNRGWLIIVTAALGLCGCNEPVRIGIQAARAAGEVPARPAAIGQAAPQASPPVHRVAAVAAAPQGRAAITAPPVPQPAEPGQIVGFLLQNTTDTPMKSRAVRFGQVFVPGQMPSGSGLVASTNGKVVPTQLDAQASNPDGSIRFGIVTIIAPPLSPGQSMPFMLSRSPASTEPAIPLARLGNADIGIDITVRDGEHYHLNVGQIAAEAVAANHVSLWRHGPVATEARIDKPVVGSLHMVFDIAADAAGGVTTDVQFRNDYAMQPVGGLLWYDVSVSSNGKVILHQDNVRHLQYTDWHIMVHSDGQPDPHVVHDAAYILRSHAVLHYDLAGGVDPIFLAGEAKQLGGPGFGILGNAGLAMGMGMTGARPDIGPETAAAVAWIISQDPTAAAYAIAQADADGTIPWHLYDVAHGHQLSLDDYPKIWTDSRGAFRGPGGGLTQQSWPFNNKGDFIVPYSKCECFTLDWAHQPDPAYVPYLMTGIRYYLDLLVDQAAWNLVGATPRQERMDKGIIMGLSTTWGQIRGNAWALRTIDNAAYITPDHYPLKSYLEKMRDNNYKYLEDHTAEFTRDEGEAYGYFFTYIGKNRMIPPWQLDYMGLAVGQAATQGYEPARRVYKWMANFLVNRFLNADHGFDPHDATDYQIIIVPPGEPLNNVDPAHFYKTWKEIGEADEASEIATHGHWTQWTFPMGQLEALADLSTIIDLLDYPGARKAYAWLKAETQAKPPMPQRALEFDIVPATEQ